MTWIKICGITNVLDAQEAVACGADALGFIFTESKRRIDLQSAKEIIASLPKGIEKIGVFLDEKPDKVREIAEFCGLTGLQFHGDESPGYCRSFNDFWVIKSFRVNKQIEWDKILQYTQAEAVHRILLDTHVEGIPGGTGKSFPWKLLATQKPLGVSLIIAGGITSLNATVAVEETKAFGIDVCSGVEKNPGKKDIDKLRSLIFQLKNSAEVLKNGLMVGGEI